MRVAYIKFIVLPAIIAGMGFSAGAIPISGVVNFVGGATLNGGDLASSTAFTGFSSLSVQGGSATGSYAPLNGGGDFLGTLSFSTFDFAGNVLNPNPLTLWTLQDGAITYSFTANSVFIVTQTSTFLNLTGTGIAHIDGYDDTAGTWTITDTGHGPTFTFGSGSTIPDAGTTGMLLAVGLSGLLLLKAKTGAKALKPQRSGN